MNTFSETDAKLLIQKEVYEKEYLYKYDRVTSIPIENSFSLHWVEPGLYHQDIDGIFEKIHYYPVDDCDDTFGKTMNLGAALSGQSDVLARLGIFRYKNIYGTICNVKVYPLEKAEVDIRSKFFYYNRCKELHQSYHPPIESYIFTALNDYDTLGKNDIYVDLNALTRSDKLKGRMIVGNTEDDGIGFFQMNALVKSVRFVSLMTITSSICTAIAEYRRYLAEEIFERLNKTEQDIVWLTEGIYFPVAILPLSLCRILFYQYTSQCEKGTAVRPIYDLNDEDEFQAASKKFPFLTNAIPDNVFLA